MFKTWDEAQAVLDIWRAEGRTQETAVNAVPSLRSVEEQQGDRWELYWAEESCTGRARAPRVAAPTRTPTGHTYRSHPPSHPRARPSPSRAEIVFARDVVLIA